MSGTERLVEWELAGETKVLGENLTQLPQSHFVHHRSHMNYQGSFPFSKVSRLPPCSAIVKNAYSIAFISIYVFMVYFISMGTTLPL
jgi:hypothetical protein